MRMYSDPMSNIQKSRECFSLRILLLVWAYFRLLVSVLWTSFAVISLPTRMLHSYDENFLKDPQFLETLMMHPIFLMIQLTQIGMLITLIVAGYKRNVTLYRIYYIYAIIDFVIYVFLMVTSVLPIMPEWSLLDVYISTNIFEVYAIRPQNAIYFDEFVFLLDVCLEITLIWLLKKQIAKLAHEPKSGTENSTPINMEKSTESV